MNNLDSYLRGRIRWLSEEAAKSSGSRKIEAGARIKELMRLKEAAQSFVTKRRIPSPVRPIKEKQFVEVKEQEVIKDGKEIDGQGEESPRSEPSSVEDNQVRESPRPSDS